MADCKIVEPCHDLYRPPWPDWSSKELPGLHWSYSICIAAVYSKELNGRGISNEVTNNYVKIMPRWFCMTNISIYKTRSPKG